MRTVDTYAATFTLTVWPSETVADLVYKLKMKLLVVLLCVLGLSVAQTVTIDPVGAVTAVEGNNLTITCTDGASAGTALGLRENGVLFTGRDAPSNQVNGSARIYQFLVGRAQNGNRYDCVQLFTANVSPVMKLTVTYPPEYTAPVLNAQLMVGAAFSFNCTPSAANPPVDTVSVKVDGSPVTSGDNVTVTDNIVTIPSVQRSHSGNYSCTATNTVGSAVIYNNLLVVGPPSAPRAVATPVVGFLNAQLIWTAPEDDGGVSDPSWNPSIDGRQSTTTLTYIVTLTNGTATRTKNLSLVLSNLQHSTAYSVSVKAENVYGRGPMGVTAFTTSTDLLSAVIGLGAALGVALLFAGAIFTAMVLCLCARKCSSSCSKNEGTIEMNSPNPQDNTADAELNQGHPKSHSKSTAEPQYEECEGSMTSIDVAMEDNPAYQPVDVHVAAAESATEESTYYYYI